MAAAGADGLAPWAGGLAGWFASSAPVGSCRRQSPTRRPGSKTGIPCLPADPAKVPPRAAGPFVRPRWLPYWSTRQPQPTRAALRQALSPPASLGKPLRLGQNRIILTSEPQKVNWPANPRPSPQTNGDGPGRSPRPVPEEPACQIRRPFFLKVLLKLVPVCRIFWFSNGLGDVRFLMPGQWGSVPPGA